MLISVHDAHQVQAVMYWAWPFALMPKAMRSTMRSASESVWNIDLAGTEIGLPGVVSSICNAAFCEIANSGTGSIPQTKLEGSSAMIVPSGNADEPITV